MDKGSGFFIGIDLYFILLLWFVYSNPDVIKT